MYGKEPDLLSEQKNSLLDISNHTALNKTVIGIEYGKIVLAKKGYFLMCGIMRYGQIKAPLTLIMSIDNIAKPRWFGLVSLFNGISTFYRLFNTKAILLEEQ